MTNLTYSLRTALRLVDRPNKVRYWVLVMLRSLTGLADIVGVALLGTVGVLLTDQKSEQATTLIRLLNVESLTQQTQIAMLCSVALAIFILKGMAATGLNYLIFRVLGRAELDLGERILESEVGALSSRTSQGTLQQTSFDLTTGLLASTTRLLGFLGVTVGELTSLVALTALMITIDPLVAVSALVFFGLTGALIHFIVADRSQRYGQRLSSSTVESMELVHNALALSREIQLSRTHEHMLAGYRESRRVSVNSNAALLSLSTLPRHIVEVSLFLGIGLMALISYMTLSVTEASVAIGLFALIGARLTPTVLAAQGAIAAMSVATGEGSGVLGRSVKVDQVQRETETATTDPVGASPPSIRLDSVSVKLGESPILQDISLSIDPGTVTGIVGFSGSGKSTLLDVILGFIQTSGTVQIDNCPMPVYLDRHPYSVAYVPQQPIVLRGTISENVALYQTSPDLERVSDVLEIVGLYDLAEGMRRGQDEQVGALGRELSGGEAQKLSIARAIYKSPSLLVLDEPTSSLDGVSETTIVGLIDSFRGQMTIVMTAHRYQSVEKCDQLVWLHGGQVKMIGTPSDIIPLISQDSGSREA